jgi:hypothetical protein|tara:strand:+ start:2419 stop:2607 length:189 start_codon:yes stop_codon:yes gene_type:complete
MADGKDKKQRAPQRKRPLFIVYKGDGDLEIVNATNDAEEVLSQCLEDKTLKYHKHDMNKPAD